MGGGAGGGAAGGAGSLGPGGGVGGGVVATGGISNQGSVAGSAASGADSHGCACSVRQSTLSNSLLGALVALGLTLTCLRRRANGRAVEAGLAG